MDGSVAGIFKTLLKVPIFIMTSFLIFNLFSFVISYLNILNASSIAMIVAMDNNYIPPNERDSLNNYFGSIETHMLQDIRFTGSTNLGESNRKQYGEEVTIGVEGRFNIIMPLMPTEYLGGDVDGLGSVSRAHLTDLQLEQMRVQKNNYGAGFGIKKEYKIPGMKYYADKDID